MARALPVLLGLASTLLVVPWWRFASDMPKLLLLCALAPWLFAFGIARLRPAALVLGALCALSLWLNGDLLDWCAGAFYLLPLALGLCLRLDLDAYLKWFTIGLVANLGVALAQHFGILVWLEASPDHPSGLLMNQNFLAEALALSVLWLVDSKRYAFALVLGACLLFVPSKEAVLALSVGLAGTFGVPGRWLALIGALTLGALWLVQPLSFTVRIDLWGSAFTGWADRPWGHGLGSFYRELPLYAKESLAYRDEHAHNEFLEFLFELGPAGAALLVFLFCSARRAPLALALGAEACCAFPLHVPTLGLTAGLVLGNAWGAQRELGANRLARQRSLLSGIALSEHELASLCNAGDANDR